VPVVKVSKRALKKALDEHIRNDPEFQEELIQQLTQQEREKFLARRKGKTVPFDPYFLRQTPRGYDHGLIVGDPHAIPGKNNRRFEWLGRMVHDLAPDWVVIIGDLFDFPSLLGFDKKGKGSKSFEGKRYYRDVEAGRDALDRFRFFRDGWDGHLYFTLGNHEQRIDRVLDSGPQIEALVSYDDLGLEDFTVVLPGERMNLCGVEISHFHQRTHSTGGKYPAIQMLNNRKVSFIQGHTHRRDFVQFEKIHCLDVGCYFDYHHDWLPEAEQRQYWRGIVELTDVHDGMFNPKFWGIDEIERKYS